MNEGKEKRVVKLLLLASGISFLAFFVLLILENSSMKTNIDKGLVINKIYIPSSTKLLRVGKIIIPSTQPEQWVVEVNYSDKVNSVTISKTDWENLSVGDNISVTYKVRSSGKTYHIESIQKK